MITASLDIVFVVGVFGKLATRGGYGGGGTSLGEVTRLTLAAGSTNFNRGGGGGGGFDETSGFGANSATLAGFTEVTGH